MDYYKLQSKIVIDINGKKIGTIVRIDDSIIIGDEETDPYAIIKLHPLFYRGKLFPFPILETTEYKIMGDEVRLNITKKQFIIMFKQHQAEKKRSIEAAKMASVDKNDMAMAVNYRTKF